MSDLSRINKVLIAAIIAVPVTAYFVKKYFTKSPSAFRIEDVTDERATLEKQTSSLGSWNALGLEQPLVIVSYT